MRGGGRERRGDATRRGGPKRLANLLALASSGDVAGAVASHEREATMDAAPRAPAVRAGPYLLHPLQVHRVRPIR